MKIQHALRAFTPKDRDAIKKTSENYPVTDFYKTDELLTNLGIGEALVTVLSEKGIPTPLAHTMMIAPRTRMDVITNDELSANVNASALVKKYNEELDRESAFEMLNAKLQEASAQAEEEKAAVEEEKEEKKAIGGKAEKSTFQKVAESKVTQIVVKEVTRGLLGVLGFKSTTSRRKKTGLFGF
jgi:hypothetical protein